MVCVVVFDARVDIQLAPAIGISPVPGGNTLRIGREAGSAVDVGLEQVALDTPIYEDTPDVRYQDLFGLVIQCHSFGGVTDQRIGLRDQVVVVGITPGVTASR